MLWKVRKVHYHNLRRKRESIFKKMFHVINGADMWLKALWIKKTHQPEKLVKKHINDYPIIGVPLYPWPRSLLHFESNSSIPVMQMNPILYRRFLLLPGEPQLLVFCFHLKIINQFSPRKPGQVNKSTALIYQLSKIHWTMNWIKFLSRTKVANHCSLGVTPCEAQYKNELKKCVQSYL